MAEGDFWNDQTRAQSIVQEVKTLRGWAEPWDSLSARVQSALELDEMLQVESDANMEQEVDREVDAIGEELESFRLRSLLQHPDDVRDAQVEISAGAGGTEAQDWAQMLMRMYERWAQRKGYGLEVLIAIHDELVARPAARRYPTPIKLRRRRRGTAGR